VHGYTDPGDIPEVETIFQVFEGAGHETALIDGKGGRISGLEAGVSIVRNDVDFRWKDEAIYQPGYEDPECDLRVMENVIRIFVENRPTLLFVLLPGVDLAGHLYSHTSDEYLEAIETADRAIGMLVENLKELGVYENTLLFILSDHGMTGKDHGSRDPGDMTIPLIVRGPGVQVGEFTGGRIVDVAPTATALFGLRAPAGAQGRNLFGEEAAPLELAPVAVAAVLVVVIFCFALYMWGKRGREVAMPAQPAPASYDWF
jgi:hypothetical protein